MQGWKVVVTKGLRSIASEIDSQTEAIRQGVLVAIVAAWEKIDHDKEKKRNNRVTNRNLKKKKVSVSSKIHVYFKKWKKAI